MAREIKTKLTIDGEQQYKRAIKDANTALHTLGTELSLASAQFKADGDAMKLMESRSKTLKAELEQQSKVIENTEKALQQATRQYGENSKQAQDWQAKLNTARAKLMNLEHELDNNSQGLDKNGKAFDSASGKAAGFGSELQQVDKISKGVTFQALDTALTNIGGIFERVGQTAARAWKAVWNTAGESSNWADDLATMSQQTGVSIGTLQKWLYSADFIDTDVGTITKAMKRFVNASGDVNDALKQLGIHGKEAWLVVQDNGAVDSYETTYNAMELFWQTIDKLHAMNEEMELADLAGDITKATELERTMEQLSQALYGKSFAEMQPLIKAGREAWEEYGKQAEETGAVLSDDLVNNLTLFNDSLQTLQNDFDAFKNTFSADLAPGLTKVSDAVSKVLEQFTLWAQSEQGQKAIGDLGEAIGGLVSSFTDNIDFEAVVTGVTGAINGLTGALNWFSENGDAVKAIILGIGTAIAGIKVTKGLLSFAAVMRIAGGDLFKGGGGSPSAGVPTTEAPNTRTSGGEGWLVRAGKWLWEKAEPLLLDTPLGAYSALYGATIPMQIMDKVATAEKKAFLTNARDTALLAADDGGRVTAAKDAIFTATEALEQTVTGLGNSMTEIGDALNELAGTEAGGGITRLINLNRGNEGGFTIGAEYELLGRYLRDEMEVLSDPETARNVDSLAQSFKDITDVIDEAENNFGARTPERVIKALYGFAENGDIGALSPSVQAALGQYFTDAELYGKRGPQFYPEALDMLRLIAGDMYGAYSPTLPGNVKNPFDILSLAAMPKIPGITGERPERELSLSYISDFLDDIIALDEAFDGGYTAENAEALYQLIDGLKDSNLRGALPKDTNDLLDKYFDLDSGFGAGGPNQFTDARGLLGVIFEDLSNAWDEGMSDTTGAEEAGKGLADAAAAGVINGAGGVSAAANALVSAIVSAFANAPIPAPRVAGSNYNSNSSLNIGTLNNYSGADVEALMAQMNRQQRYAQMGRGQG